MPHPTPTTLTSWLAALEPASWSAFVDAHGSDWDELRGAWAASSDPVALLRFLELLHPPRHQQTAIAIAAQLSATRRLSHLATVQRGWLDGRRLNGPDVFSFRALAQTVKRSLRPDGPADGTLDDEALQTIAAQLVQAVRAVVPDPQPYLLDDAVCDDHDDGDPGAPRIPIGTRVRLTSGEISTVRSASLGAKPRAWLYEIEHEFAALRHAGRMTRAK